MIYNIYNIPYTIYYIYIQYFILSILYTVEYILYIYWGLQRISVYLTESIHPKTYILEIVNCVLKINTCKSMSELSRKLILFRIMTMVKGI